MKIKSYSLEEEYNQIIDCLGYKASSSYVPDEDNVYDNIFYVEINNIKYPLVGIKKLDEIIEDQIDKLHLKFWNRNDIPISILVFPGEYRIYNNFTINTRKKLLTKRQLIVQEGWLEKLNINKVTSRVVWDQIAQLSQKKERVDKRLLDSLYNTVLFAHNYTNMSIESAYGFMSQCIFVKYLEDRKMLSNKYFNSWGVNNFTSLLKKNDVQILRLFFESLKQRFNGDIFDVSSDSFPDKNDQIIPFLRFFSGEELTKDGFGQINLFPFDFSYIPIELISNIYESFFELENVFTKRHKKELEGAYYTPYNLAEFMINKQFQPWLIKDTVPIVLDPACGSGVFLVASYKKQVSILKSNKEYISQQELVDLLTTKIKGVDINIGALKITSFSLYLALLDEMDPKDIDESGVRFPILIGKNLIHGSFFSDTVTEAFQGKYCDIVVGNPPWKSVPMSDHVIYCKKKKIPISDNQLAQAFLIRSGEFLSEKGLSTLLVTNSIFSNKNSSDFLDYLLNNYRIYDILNLEAIKGRLFENATYPCSIITYSSAKEENYTFIYNTFEINRIYLLYNKFVWDRNNDKKVSKKIIISKKYLWNLLIYGDEFDALCVDTIMEHPVLSNLIEGKLTLAQGYVPRKKGEVVEAFSHYKGGSLKGTFKPYFIDYEKISPVPKEQKYDRPRTLDLYLCKSKLLVKRTYNEKTWGAARITQPLVFSNDFSSFNDNSGDYQNLLLYIEGVLNSKLFKYYAYYVSKIKSAKRPELTLDDLRNFPIPEYNEKAGKLIKLVIKMEAIASNAPEPGMQYECNIHSLQEEIDNCVFEIYGLSDFYIAIINEGIQRFESMDFEASDSDYQSFAQYLLGYFNYYRQNNSTKIWRYYIEKGQYYTEIIFKYDNFNIDYGESPDLTDFIGTISLDPISSTFLVQNQLFNYYQDGFSIIQPNNKGIWSKARAMKLAIKMTKLIMEGDKFG